MNNESEEVTESEEGKPSEEERLAETATDKETEEAEEIEEAQITSEGTEKEAEEEPEEEAGEAEEVEEAEAAEVERRRKEEVEEEIVEERIYTIPLGRAWISPRRKRAPRAVRLIKSFIQRHMKLQGGSAGEELEEARRLVISNDVNERVWRRGIEKPPRKIRVRVTEDKEGVVTVYLAEGA
jgi:large subunit ribosomal protein L31e